MALPTILVKPLQTRDTIYALQTGLLKVTIQTKKFWLNRDLIFSEKGSFFKPKETNIYFDVSISSGELVGRHGKSVKNSTSPFFSLPKLAQKTHKSANIEICDKTA